MTTSDPRSARRVAGETVAGDERACSVHEPTARHVISTSVREEVSSIEWCSDEHAEISEQEGGRTCCTQEGRVSQAQVALAHGMRGN